MNQGRKYPFCLFTEFFLLLKKSIYTFYYKMLWLLELIFLPPLVAYRFLDCITLLPPWFSESKRDGWDQSIEWRWGAYLLYTVSSAVCRSLPWQEVSNHTCKGNVVLICSSEEVLSGYQPGSVVSTKAESHYTADNPKELLH